MIGYFLLLYPGRIGLLPLDGSETSGFPRWRWTGDLPNLMDEPALLANLAREMTGDSKACDFSIGLHPSLCRQIMFSHTARNRRELQRLRRAELETVLRRTADTLFTYDLILHNPEDIPAAKERRLIYTLPREWVTLLREAFSAQGMKLRRIVPLDILCAESAVRSWAPADRNISLCLTLDEACVSTALVQDGHIVAMRTDPAGVAAARKSYGDEASNDWGAFLESVHRNGIEHEVDTPGYAAVADALMRVLGQLAADSVKMLHAVFGTEAKIDQVLLCGSLASAAGIKTYFDTIFEEDCRLICTQTMETVLTAAAANTQVDLLQQIRRERKARRSAAAVCALLCAVCVACIAAIPVQTVLLRREQRELEVLLSTAEYGRAAQLYTQREELLRQKAAWEAAVAALPHSRTDTAGIVSDLMERCAPFGTVNAVRVECTTAVITLDFTAASYDDLIDWQRMIADSSRFQLLEMPTFSTGGTSYAISAKLTAADFSAEGGD